MLIYSFERVCYHCKEKIKAYTYIHYQDFYEDVVFPYQSWIMDEVYAHIHHNEPFFDKDSLALNYPVYVLGNNSELDNIVIQSNKVPNVDLFHSSQVAEPYTANYCPNCKRYYGKYYLLEYVTDNHLKSNVEMKVEFEI